jgi:hypothetical protein
MDRYAPRDRWGRERRVAALSALCATSVVRQVRDRKEGAGRSSGPTAFHMKNSAKRSSRNNASFGVFEFSYSLI